MSMDDGRQDFFTIRYGTVKVDSISPKGWVMAIRFLLECFKPFLEKAFLKGQPSANTFGAMNDLFFNYSAAKTGVERKAKDEVIDSRAGITKETRCVKVRLLAKKKRKGIWHEKWLIVRSDFAKLFILKLWYKSIPRRGRDSLTASEIVTKSELVPDLSVKEDRERFEKEILPFLDSKFFAELVQIHLLPVFEYWKQMKEEHQRIQGIMRDPLDILKRLEIVI